jgi:RHS repeat-associated protein
LDVLTVAEYNANGTLDQSFGTSGLASVTISGVVTGPVLNIQIDGQIVLGAGETSGDFVLVRFNADGTKDTTFGSSGIETGAAISGGLAMITASNGETILIGTPSSGAGIILQEFHTLAKTFTYYAEYDADYNVTSITDASGNVLEKYDDDSYGNVEVLNPDGTERGDGTVASSDYGQDVQSQGMTFSTSTGLYFTDTRVYSPSLGRPLTPDPLGAAYPDGPNDEQWDLGNPVGNVDPSGMDANPTEKPLIGWVYRIVGVDENGKDVTYTGSSVKDVLKRVDSKHPMSKFMKDPKTKVCVRPVYGQPDPKASGRGTQRSATNEALRSQEQKTMIQNNDLPGESGVQNKVAAATEENLPKWEAAHNVEMGEWKEVPTQTLADASSLVAVAFWLENFTFGTLRRSEENHCSYWEQLQQDAVYHDLEKVKNDPIIITPIGPLPTMGGNDIWHRPTI